MGSFSCLALILALLPLGCAGAPGTQPHDMSASQHEAAAAQEDSFATTHAAQHDPAATTTTEKCRSARGKGGGEPICWSSTVNPTEQHRRDAEEHRKIAEQHRAAAQALQSAEEKVCGGIAEEDRETSPFYHREDIVRVERLEESRPIKGGGPPELKGAIVVFRAVPGLTAEWFQRLISCHIARNAAMGHDPTHMTYCPLALKDVTASVTSTGDGFAVEVRGPDRAAAEEILRRARALLPP